MPREFCLVWLDGGSKRPRTVFYSCLRPPLLPALGLSAVRLGLLAAGPGSLCWRATMILEKELWSAALDV